ncbi:MAG: amino acid adenylation domain-containing protein [Ardenticatenaceae bacterium]|nr:amino acid adenylation domain-containing protein [Ardenticatenaceae bacterium]
MHTNHQQIGSESNLTHNQFLMWLGQQLNPEVPLYNMIQTFRIRGELDFHAFQKAFQTLIDKNDALRTIIEVKDGVPQQRVLDQRPFTIDVVDFSTSTDPEAAVQEWLNGRKVQMLDLEQQLFDTALLKLSATETIWYLNQHHVMTDGQSFAVMYGQMSELYELALAAKLDQAPDYPQYADFIAYEKELQSSESWQEAVRFWQEKLETQPQLTDFYGRTVQHGSPRTNRIPFKIGPERSARLREIAMEDGFASLSLDLSLFTIFATLLLSAAHRISGRRDMRLGMPFHARPTAAFKETIGLFIEIGPLQVAIEDRETFVSLGEKVLEDTFAGLMNAQAGISSADLNRSYDLLLNYVNAHFADFAGLPVETDWIHTGYGDQNHALRLQVVDFDGTGSFTLLFDLNTAVFGETETAWLINQFEAVLEAFLADFNRPLGSFSLTSKAENSAYFEQFNQTDATYPQEKTIVALFESQVARTPNAVAAVRGEQSLTYGELNQQANRLAHYLQAWGVGPEKTVAICFERSLETLVAIWGILKAGGAYVPVDPAYPAHRQRFMLEDAAPTMVLTAGNLLAKVPDGVAVVDLLALDLSDYAAENPPPAAGPDNLVYMIYTSGSTGQPKGTMLRHQGLVNYIWWAREVYQQGDVLDFPLYSSLSFDLTVTSTFVPLVSGGKIVVYSEADHVRGLEILSVFRDDAVDIVKLTPAHLELVQEAAVNCQRIRKLIVGGEDFKTDLALRIHHAFDGQIDMYNEYGPTEAVVGCMIHRFDPQTDTAVSVPIGTPAANARIYLLDEYRQPVPSGVLGEMFISSDGVARGYHNQPELTAERFTADPFRPGARMYQTGDVARWGANGRMIFLGRRDHQVKINGVRIELGEIEAKLAAHPNIKDAVVHVVQYEKPSQEEKPLRFCLTCGLPSNYPDITFNDEGICEFCTDFDRFREDVFQYFKSEKELDAIIEQTKAQATGDYDCMMLYSGGKDSSYVLSQLVEKGLRVLAWSLDNGYISEDAKENIRRVTEHLGVDLVFATTPHMNAIFADSLQRFSNVCNGCYKAIYTLSMNLARQKGIRTIFTGLSRGQLFETRLHELFRNRQFDVEQMDHAIAEARKVYHRVDDAVYRLLDVSMFKDDRIFDQIQFVDFFRYTDVVLEEMYDFLGTRVPWIRPEDTGRSTNCLINEMGIHVHKTERGYHNYALPYSWDVRLGHKTREEALEELDDDIRMPMVQQMLGEVGYEIKYRHDERTEKRLAAYFVADHSLTIAKLREYLAAELPDFMIPAYFVRLEALPLTQNGKVDRAALPSPADQRPELESTFVAPETDVESQLAGIWVQTLNLKRVGIYDNFFDVGGNSVPAVQIVAKINRHFEIDFPLRSFFESPTISAQAELIEELVLADLESLSDEEIEALLAEMEE